MQPTEVIDMIKSVVPDAEIKVEGEDCSFAATVISPAFKAMMPVKRQQLVLGPFSSLITQGTLHALSVKAVTPEEWRAQQSSNLIQL